MATGDVKGTAGYNQVVESFTAATLGIAFEDLHQPYLDLIPERPGRILDIGAGIGRDAAVLASMNHTVVAVEPLRVFRDIGKSLHHAHNIHWVDDALPDLSALGRDGEPFDFVLASAVWHHLDEPERRASMSRIFELVRIGGTFALSLRNGPTGSGTHVFPTDYQQTIESAENLGFKAVAACMDQPSLIPGKCDVKWAKLAFRRG